MSTKSVLWILLCLFSLSWEISNHTFDVVSTSHRPPYNQQFEEALIQTEKNFKEEIQKVNRRLEAIESQNSLTLEHCLHQQKQSNLPKNCQDVLERGYDVSATYLIQPDFAPSPNRVLCELERRGGGWSYILKRSNGSQNFDLDWEHYRRGFGDFHSDFWLGLENIHFLTGYKINELLIELVDWNGTEVYAQYDSFSVGSEKEGYKLKILKGYNGTAGDSLNYHSAMKFTTKDRDHDLYPDGNCASHFGGGWWFNYCKWSFLTGQFFNTNVSATGSKGIHWDAFRGYNYSLKEVRMMVRPRSNIKPTIF